nr:hypothetical protein [Pseudomonas peli]
MNLRVVASLLGRGKQLERVSDGLTLLAWPTAWPPGCALQPLASSAVRRAAGAWPAAKVLGHPRGHGCRTVHPPRQQQPPGSGHPGPWTAPFELKLKPQATDARAWPERSQAALGLLRRQAVCRPCT